MIKRDTIRRYIIQTETDSMGGTGVSSLCPQETVVAHVSINSTLGEITQYGVKNELVLHVITDIKLDNRAEARYLYCDKYFRVMRQVKQGNEYYSTLLEVNQGGVV